MAGKSDRKEVLLEAKELGRVYIDGERRLAVLQDVSLKLHDGEFLSIVGHSGSGKSTLLHLLGALDKPTTGTVTLRDKSYAKLSDRDLARLRSTNIGFVFQFHHLLPEFTALENVMMPGMISGLTQGEIVGKAEGLLRSVGLGQRMDHRPTKLSGGEQQRVAIARALLNDPAVVLADEPTGNLDARTSGEVLEFLVGVTRDAGKSLVMVTHDLGIAAKADDSKTLKEGRLVAG